MYLVNDDMSIYVTRGDAVAFTVTAEDQDGNLHHFSAGDTIRFTVVEKKACENVALQKTFGIEADTTAVEIFLTEADTRIGDVISKPTDYWYEVELNPFTNPQTIIGYDEDGPRVFKLFPEGAEIEDIIDPEDIPIVDDELDLTSERPVQNQAIARAIITTKTEVMEKADTALSIAKGRNQAHVFDTTADMNEWLSVPENAGKCNVGDNLYIVEVDVPDWWVSEVLVDADPETGFYYKVAKLETQKVDLTEIDADFAGLAGRVSANEATIAELNSKISKNENFTLIETFDPNRDVTRYFDWDKYNKALFILEGQYGSGNYWHVTKEVSKAEWMALLATGQNNDNIAPSIRTGWSQLTQDTSYGYNYDVSLIIYFRSMSAYSAYAYSGCKTSMGKVSVYGIN